MSLGQPQQCSEFEILILNRSKYLDDKEIDEISNESGAETAPTKKEDADNKSKSLEEKNEENNSDVEDIPKGALVSPTVDTDKSNVSGIYYLH